MHGKLFLVATPIGNLQDITLRALEALRTVDVIAAEDTRHTAVLLRHYEIDKPTLSYHDFNERTATRRIISLLEEGKSVALVTDAGTPGISDPAFYLVRAALEAQLEVEALPGATALIPALILSGLPCHRFAFEGFPPSKKGRRTFFKKLAAESRTVVLYESPHRVKRTLQQILEEWGDRRIAVVRELTKMYEEVKRGLVSELIAEFDDKKLRGEFVIVVAGATPDD